MTGHTISAPLEVAIGGWARAELIEALTAAGVALNPSAETLLGGPEFDRPHPHTVRVVERSVAELGLADGATLPMILTAAAEDGLLVCPAVTGPYLRLAVLDQPNAPDTIMSKQAPPSAALTVATARTSAEFDHPRGFYLRVVDSQPWLRGYRCTDDAPWQAQDRFVFRVGQP
ncbi:hypothetical protein [Microlunatus sp. GCM10028923]|uniref:hypothetical protein n=1 Tax=Microlunatus sp. GCM10028923 TaxID=3273400 RepID=UPI0036169A0A